MSEVATHPTALAAYRQHLERSRRRRLAPPPNLTVSAWADRHRMLPSESSPEPGRWSTDRAPYQRQPMDALGDPMIERIVLMWAAQTGKTEIILNHIGYTVDLSPGPGMFVVPTIDMAMAYSKDRVAPMIRDSPRLRPLFGDPTSRSSNNTLLHKPFPGGQLTIGGSNSPASLSSRPISRLWLDEVDRYPESAGTEGDPVSLAEARTSNFPLRKIVMTSTPGTKGESRIEEAFEESDQRYRFLPCLHCGHTQRLEWPRLRFEGLVEPCYQCERCEQLIGEEHKHRMDMAGEWVPLNPGAAVVGFHLNVLYSPWKRWSEVVDQWQTSQGNPLRLQAFINTRLAETWEERGDRIGAEGLAARREQYPDKGQALPAGVVAITAGIDVQADRIEVYHRGWGKDEESWILGVHVATGDITTPTPWQALDEKVWHPYRTLDGEVMTAHVIAIDAGYATQAVLDWATPRLARRVYAVKGDGGEEGKPIVSRRPVKSGVGRGRIWTVGTLTSQDKLYGQLRIAEPGPGYIHLPDWFDDDLIGQLTAEVKKPVKWRRKWVKRWDLPRGRRNEAADCLRYNDAARELGGLTRTRLAHLANTPRPDATPAEPIPASHQPPPPPRRGNWVTGWKR